MLKIFRFAIAVTIASSSIFALTTFASEPANAAVDDVVASTVVGTTPLGVATSPDGAYVYVANYYDGTLDEIRTSDNTVINSYPTGINPRSVAVSPDGNLILVTNNYSNTVTVINKATNPTNVIQIPVGIGPVDIDINSIGTRAYVSNQVADSVSVIALDNNYSTTSFAVSGGPFSLAVTPDDSKLVISRAMAPTVAVVTLANNSVIDIPHGMHFIGSGVAVNPSGTRAYVSTVSGIAVIRLSDNTHISTITGTTGGNDAELAITPDGSKLYATSYFENLTYVISLSDNTVTSSVGSPRSYGVAISPSGEFAYVATESNGYGALNVIRVAEPMVLDFAIDQNMTSVSLPLDNFVGTVSWGDGTFSTALSAANYGSSATIHTYPSTSLVTRTVRIVGSASGFGQAASAWTGSPRLLAVTSWGDLGSGFIDLSYAFWGSELLTDVPATLPSSVTHLFNSFAYCQLFDDPDITTWNTANVVDLAATFLGASTFNQDISSWNTSNVIRFSSMFRNASAFSQNLGSWNISNVTDMSSMFTGTNLSTSNYSRILHAWAQTSNRQSNVALDAQNSSYYSTVNSNRNILLNAGWTIHDAGSTPGLLPTVTQSPSASAILEGQTLSQSSLVGGTASVSGVFSFSSPSASPSAGSSNIQVTFTPTDNVIYQNVSFTIPVTVNAHSTPSSNSATQLSNTGRDFSNQVDLSWSAIAAGLLFLLCARGVARYRVRKLS